MRRRRETWEPKNRSSRSRSALARRLSWWTTKSPCPTCGGNGLQRVRRQVDVKIPAGVKSDQRVRVAGEGAGTAGTRGDLYLTVTVAPHPFFERKGDDIHLSLPVTAPEAALGAALEVPTLRGRVSMKIPSATSSGRTFRLP